MLKKFLTTLALLTFSTATAQAFPSWAVEVASNQCRYMAMGLPWDEASRQALRDAHYWAQEIGRNHEVSAALIVNAAYEICPNLYTRSYQEYKKQNPDTVYQSL